MKLAWFMSSLCVFASMSAIHTSDKRVYLDMQDMDMTDHRFHIHVGDNEWVETDALFCDPIGIYTLESNIIQGADFWGTSYEQTWQCPYCHYVWPKNVSCQNKDCPSKYK